MRALITVAIFSLLVACTPTIYGVPQDRWDLMTENERIAAMETYKERQIAYQRAAAERARIRAEQEAIRQAQLEDERRRRQERVDLIYRGRAGSFGDLIEVTFRDGVVRLNGKKRSYSTVTFQIADGEVREVPLYDSSGRMENVYVFYDKRHLWLDTDPYGGNTRRAGHLVYNQDWEDGITYTGINSHGARDMRHVTVDIEVLPIRRGRARSHQKPVVIVREKVVEVPTKVIIKEKVVHKPEKVIIKEKVVKEAADVPRENDSNSKKWQSRTEDNVSGGNNRQERIQEKKTTKEGGAKEEGRPDKADKQASSELRPVHVELNGGKVLLAGKHQPFKPVNFMIRDGETRTIILVSKKGNVKETLSVSYVGGQLFFDGTPESGSSGVLTVNNGRAGSVSSSGQLKMRGVKVKTKVD